MRWIVLVVSVLMLAGCMKPSDMQKEARYYLGDTGLMDHYQIHRSASRTLQSDSQLYIAQGHFVPVGHPYARPNVVAEEAFAAAVQVFPLVRRAEQPLGLEEALLAARMQRAHYLMYTRFASAREGVSTTEQWERRDSWSDVGIDRAVLQLILIETSTEHVVDFVTIETRGGFLQFYKANAEDLLRPPLEDYTRRLLGR
ncbi:protein of unknown function [Halopseudomonas xinjiangensis]|uniref:DUF4823 domain-containing protein n=1 Tax=Halopseudomonas xinjiangensis TaxID=487184 RepID=A0A1H1RHZ5_9GAMM|nr:DUF4823 domain-containing protein [Halopseudomonas xinjiangensis]SDS35166.1 protein of unknown function [Halopseudomonas xinjiangensis]